MARSEIQMPGPGAPTTGNRLGNTVPLEPRRPTPRRQPKAMSVFRQPGGQQPPAGIRKPDPQQKSQARLRAIRGMK